MKSLLVKKAALSETKWNEQAAPDLADGEILLEVEKYALTANNITYAVAGDSFGYWNFFPSGNEDWGIVPVWGFAIVAASNHPDITVGERVYGYLPMGSHLVAAPVNVSGSGFIDGAAHRQPMAIIYNQYQRLGTETAQYEDERALFQPLFMTSFLIEDFMRQSGWHGAEAVLLTSASSKTALGLAKVCQSNSPEIKRIGMTSPTNRDFVEGSGLYDQILTYDELGMAVKDQAIVSVDFAGNSKLLAAIHDHWGDNLKFSSLVGMTHISERSNAGEMKGPEPVLFFAPTAAETLIKDIGPVEFRTRVDGKFADFISDMAKTMTVEHLSGSEALDKAYLEMLDNKIAPNRGIICAP